MTTLGPFTALDLTAFVSPTAPGLDRHPLVEQAMASLPRGSNALWGVPVEIPPGLEGDWVWLGRDRDGHVAVPVAREPASHVVFVHFTLPTSRSLSDTGRPSGMPTPIGEEVAAYRLVLADGRSHAQPIRRRFEVNDVLVAWGQLAFAARPHRALRPQEWRGPHARGEWGYDQTSAELPDYEGIGTDPDRPVIGTCWVHAVANPWPDEPIVAIELEPRADDPVAVAAITLFRGSADPLRHDRCLTAELESADDAATVSVDLGTIARRYRALAMTRGWEDTPGAGLGSDPDTDGTSPTRYFVDFVASPAATLSIDGRSWSVAALRSPDGEQRGGRSPIRILDGPRAVASVEVVDATTGRPTPARVHFSTDDGRYLPPYGHRREVNDAWFEDYSADLLLGRTPYAYVDGRFRIELPIGPVRVEVAKGFEYETVRRVLAIEPGEPDLTLALARAFDHRAAGWITADTHVHFVSPQTAWLMGQAEGVNVVNLLAAQWGELFTNLADFTGEQAGVSGGDTIVWVGTENRQHILGHLSLLGQQGRMALPLSAAGPNESQLGDPLWTGLSGWSDEGRDHGALAIVPHFPTPDGELAAGIVLGKFDGVEIRDFGEGVDSHAVRTWYRYLNCGFRLPVVGGTDKMSAGMPIGGVRTYAFIGDQELTFASWADAVRGGRTVTTSGPILELEVDGRGVGSEVRLPRGGGSVTVRARASCVHGIGSLEIVQDGVVVAREDAGPGARQATISVELDVRRPGWLAARCEGSAVAWHEWPMRMAAHTSPIYLAVGTDAAPPPSASDRAYVRTLIEGGLTWLDILATPAGETEQARIRASFEEARRRMTDGT